MRISVLFFSLSLLTSSLSFSSQKEESGPTDRSPSTNQVNTETAHLLSTENSNSNPGFFKSMIGCCEDLFCCFCPKKNDMSFPDFFVQNEKCLKCTCKKIICCNLFFGSILTCASECILGPLAPQYFGRVSQVDAALKKTTENILFNQTGVSQKCLGDATKLWEKIK